MTERRFIGKVEAVARGRLMGWAWDRQERRAPRLAIEVNGAVVAELVPELVLPGLVKAGLGDGKGGFAWAIPAALCDPAPCHLRLLAAEDRSLIFDHPKARLAQPAEELLRAWKQEALSQGLWVLESVAEAKGQLSGAGWAIPPRAQPQKLQLLVNGRPARMTWLRRPAPEVVDALGLAGRFDSPRFRFSLALGGEGQGEGQGKGKRAAPLAPPWHVTLADAAGRSLAPGQDVWVPAAAVPQPPEVLRQRAHPIGDAAGFDRSGASAAELVARALGRVLPGGLARAKGVLDWGCGCARVGRYLLPLLGPRYLGLDSDSAAITWCRAALPGARFAVSPPAPPLELRDATMDAVLALGVMPHLDQPAQAAWLAELARVLRPGGIALLTSLGKMGFVAASRRPAEFLAWRREGWRVLRPAAPGRPFLASQLPEQIHRAWGQHLEILEVQEGGMGGYHDLVLARRRG
ncbi:class I SAM-dependent methyltransferase [Siccirubricoccus phaeus]|uniref:class I SAM-dependent methyltransferase n=1 Tax=Siccirubricoccus phaeus TaxID=2595053 RepID=UPI0011F0F647|nr:class I SAM-dependent methyltransferase [Siccirubricoccus phaeus]